VDADLRTHRIDNLYIVSTSTFPSGGGSNPTFMLMAFALRAAEHIANRLKRGSSIFVQQPGSHRSVPPVGETQPPDNQHER
jgi:choline dehydrogenase-like flavoprotein